MPKPVLNMSIDELKEEDVPQSSLNFGQVKVAKSRKVFFHFDPIQVGLVGLVVVSWVGWVIWPHYYCFFVNVT